MEEKNKEIINNLLMTQEELSKEVEALKEKIDDDVSVDEFSNVVERLEDQTTMNVELDKLNKFLIEENTKLKKMLQELRKRNSDSSRESSPIVHEKDLEMKLEELRDEMGRERLHDLERLEQSKNIIIEEWELRYKEMKEELVEEKKKNEKLSKESKEKDKDKEIEEIHEYYSHLIEELEKLKKEKNTDINEIKKEMNELGEEERKKAEELSKQYDHINEELELLIKENKK